MRPSRTLLTACLVAFTTVAGQTEPAPTPIPAGRVKVVTGPAFVDRNGTAIPAAIGDPIFEADVLRTGADGQLGVTLRDATRLSLSPNSTLKVELLQYEPAAGRLALTLKFLKGAAGYISGEIAKLSPDAVRLETPNAIVGVRGTTVVVQVGES